MTSQEKYDTLLTRYHELTAITASYYNESNPADLKPEQKAAYLELKDLIPRLKKAGAEL